MQDRLIGHEIAGFRIDALISRGGMGRVYRATQLDLDRLIALKILSQDLSDDPTFRERFVHESRIAASIDHPNVLPIYDAGEVDGLLYIAMRFVDGSDLRALLQREAPLSLRQTIGLLRQAASALDAAHQKGLVHRDVKPANLLLAEDHLYLTDFGIAKELSDSRGLTRTSAFIGTLDYAAPEQIRHEPVDARTDLYALACVVFECLTGGAPFDRPTEHAVMQGHLNEPPPPLTAIRPDLPVALDAVFATALAKSPEDRYRSGRHMRHAFEAAAAEQAQASVSALARRNETTARGRLPTPSQSTPSTTPDSPTTLEGRPPELLVSSLDDESRPRLRTRVVSSGPSLIGNARALAQRLKLPFPARGLSATPTRGEQVATEPVVPRRRLPLARVAIGAALLATGTGVLVAGAAHQSPGGSPSLVVPELSVPPSRATESVTITTTPTITATAGATIFAATTAATSGVRLTPTPATPTTTQAPKFQITGTVRDSISNLGVPSAVILAYSLDDSSLVDSVTSDPSGNFSLGLPAGGYRLHLSSSNGAFPAQDWIGTLQVDGSRGNLNVRVLWPSSNPRENARPSGQSSYQTLAPNTTTRISFTILNTGSTTWKGQGADGYGYRGLFTWSGRSWPISGDTPPGQSATFAVDQTVPATPGQYRYGVILTHNGIDFGPAFFTDVTSSLALATAPPAWYGSAMAGGGYSSSYSGESVFTNVPAGGAGQFSVIFFNDGTQVWQPGVVGLLVCLSDKNTCNVNSPNAAYASGWFSSTVYATVSASVAPGQNGFFIFNFVVPSGTPPNTLAVFNGDVGLIATGARLRPEGYYQINSTPNTAPQRGPAQVSASPTRAQVDQQITFTFSGFPVGSEIFFSGDVDPLGGIGTNQRSSNTVYITTTDPYYTTLVFPSSKGPWAPGVWTINYVVNGVLYGIPITLVR